ncbi:HprK-related kinase A [Paraglaciecola sp.]|uniref:HprK-related kinase A n=1 Tax=Paraglaciecola sp. TaxID=1920173 RepID=UPI003EF98160
MNINTGLYSFRLEHQFSLVDKATRLIYSDAIHSSEPADFLIKLRSPSFVRKYVRPQVSFYCDQHTPFKPLSATQAYALLEWGMNWCIASLDFTRLIIHSAVLVKNGKAIIFPAAPGSGKSTLTAFLSLSGWSLYSDEMAIIELDSGKVNPMFRPVCLKNDSIGLVKQWFPESKFTDICRDTQKGDVAHLKASTWEQYSTMKPVEVVGVVFPKYIPNKALTVYQLNQTQAFETLSSNAFNYGVLGRNGFEAVDNLIKNSALFEIEYGSVSEVQEFLLEEIIR